MTELEIFPKSELPRNPEHFGDNLFIYQFEKGTDMLPYHDAVMPDLIRLWTSALSRSEDDPLVMNDTEEYPFAENNRVYLVTDINRQIEAIFLHKLKNYQGISGLGVGICLVHENHQGQGIIYRLIRKAAEDLDAKFLVYHTQNQHMVAVGRKFCSSGKLFPIDGDIPDIVLDMGQTFRHHPDKYDYQNMIERDFYAGGSPLYGDRKEKISRHPEIAEFFRQHVNFQNGDAVIVIGLLDIKVINYYNK